MEPIWFALLNTATPNSLPNRNTLLQRWRYGKYLLYRSLFTQIHGSTHCTYLVIIELCGCFRVFLDYDHASFMTHTYIIRIGRLLFQWQKLLTSACRRCRVSAVAESVSDTDRSTGFAQIMCGTLPGFKRSVGRRFQPDRLLHPHAEHPGIVVVPSDFLRRASIQS